MSGGNGFSVSSLLNQPHSDAEAAETPAEMPSATFTQAAPLAIKRRRPPPPPLLSSGGGTTPGGGATPGGGTTPRGGGMVVPSTPSSGYTSNSPLARISTSAMGQPLQHYLGGHSPFGGHQHMAHLAQQNVVHLAQPHPRLAQQHYAQHFQQFHQARQYAGGGDIRFWPYPPQMAMMVAAGAAAAAAGASSSTNGTPWRRERRSKACQRCHTKKIKCEGEGAVCDGCRQAGSECRWVEMKKRGPKPKAKVKTNPKTNPNPGPAAASNGERVKERERVEKEVERVEKNVEKDVDDDDDDDLVSMDDVLRRFASTDVVALDVREAVECFFDYFYGRMPLFHPASFMRRVVAGLVDPLLLDTMKACTARIVARRTGRAIDVDALGSSVRRRLLAGLDRPTDDYVRAVVVAAALAGGEAKFMSYNSLTCLASSLVTRLGWHTLDLGRAPAAHWREWVRLEERRRTFWAVYQLDCYQALMADRPPTVDAARLFVAAPAACCAWDDVGVARLALPKPPPLIDPPLIDQPLIDPPLIDPPLPSDDDPRDAALSLPFVALCSLAAIMARASAFTWDVRMALAGAARHPPDIRFLAPAPQPPVAPRRTPAQTLFDYAEFARLHGALKAWVRALEPPEALRGAQPTAFARFGGAESRRFALRVRYFCLRCYHTPVLLLLHLANRPSFFGAAPTPEPGSRASPSSSCAPPSPSPSPSPSPAPSPSPSPAPSSSPARSADAPEDAAIRAMLGSAFSGLLNDGLLARDVVPHSWAICLREIDRLVEHLDRNADIPIDRCDASIAFCLFVPITVLVRRIRECRERAVAPDTPAADARALRQEATRRAAALRRLWAMLKDLGFIWGVARMEALLRSMQVDEIANAADLFSSLSL